MESEKVNDMKRIFALLLCVALLIAIPVGCKKNKEAEDPVLTEARIGTDLMNSDHLYFLSHVGTIHSCTDVKIVEKEEDGNTTSLSATAKVFSSGVEIDLTADMTYTLAHHYWKLDKVEITKAVPTLTGGPDLDSVLREIANYVSIVGSSLAIQGDKEHALPSFNPTAATWEMQYENGAKTAQLHISYKSAKLTFKGYYALTFGEKGWAFETKAKGDKHHILLHLESLDQK